MYNLHNGLRFSRFHFPETMKKNIISFLDTAPCIPVYIYLLFYLEDGGRIYIRNVGGLLSENQMSHYISQ
jgi:hypothetical protein